jgi:hypothetical protein
VSQPSLASPGADVPVQKQRMNVYTMMLIISFICIVTACVLLYMELKRWGNYPWWSTSEAVPRAAWVIPADTSEVKWA